jgi:hypothetical protein
MLITTSWRGATTNSCALSEPAAADVPERRIDPAQKSLSPPGVGVFFNRRMRCLSRVVCRRSTSSSSSPIASSTSSSSMRSSISSRPSAFSEPGRYARRPYVLRQCSTQTTRVLSRFAIDERSTRSPIRPRTWRLTSETTVAQGTVPAPTSTADANTIDKQAATRSERSFRNIRPAESSRTAAQTQSQRAIATAPTPNRANPARRSPHLRALALPPTLELDSRGWREWDGCSTSSSHARGGRCALGSLLPTHPFGGLRGHCAVHQSLPLPFYPCNHGTNIGNYKSPVLFVSHLH